MSKMIRVSNTTDNQIEQIRSVLDVTKQDVVRKAVDRLSRELILQQTCDAYKKLKDNPKAWKQECAERNAWLAINDGLKDE